MSIDKNEKTTSSTGPNLGRHASQCRICSHEKRHQIETDFVQWRSPARIAREYGLRDRSSVYRHAHALDLFSKRRLNVGAALERIIERVDELDEVAVNSSSIIQAVAMYARLYGRRELTEHREVNFHDLLARLSDE